MRGWAHLSQPASSLPHGVLGIVFPFLPSASSSQNHPFPLSSSRSSSLSRLPSAPKHSNMSDDLSLIGAPVTYFHSGKTAPNRFLKSAMTERLCVWSNDEAEADSRGKPTPAYISLYKQWGNDAIGELLRFEGYEAAL